MADRECTNCHATKPLEEFPKNKKSKGGRRNCGNKACSYHHHQGYEPEHHLNVIPLCKSCHEKAG